MLWVSAGSSASTAGREGDLVLLLPAFSPVLRVSKEEGGRNSAGFGGKWQHV